MFRGVAALLVVAHHMGTFSHGHFNAAFLGDWFNWGASGVDFFFVLSGFIIYYIHRVDLGHPERLRGFALKRLVRVYPIYWVACAVVIPMYFVARGTGPVYARDPVAILTTFLLVPQDHYPVLAQAWTLTHEMLFYGIFALLIANPRVFKWPALLWMLACAGFYLLDEGRKLTGVSSAHTVLFFPWDWLFSRHNVLFGAGVAVAALTRGQNGVGTSRALLWTGAALYLVFGALNQAGSPFDPANLFDYPLTFGLASALVVMGAAGLDLAGQAARPPALLLYLGNASYSIYLFHSAALSLMVRPAEKLVLSHHLGVNPAGFILCVLAVGAGCAVHSFVEQPLLNALRRRLALRGA